MVSHNHYDHLDLSVVLEIGNSAAWYVPKNLANWFKSHGITQVVELDWWQSFTHKSEKGLLEITATPVQHWSGRHFFDVNSSLWCSFAVKGSNFKLFHCGDTGMFFNLTLGYCKVFKEIGKKLGPFDLALLPIGSYEPRSYLSHQHIDPYEACLVHTDLQAQVSLGVHWGTFMMSDEHYLDPKLDFEAARVQLGLPEESIITKCFGETFKINKESESDYSFLQTKEAADLIK